MSDFATDPEAARALMRSVIQRTATGPDLSKDIGIEETRAAMRSILQGFIDPVQMGIFLISLRMKRETDDENRGILSALMDMTNTVTAPVAEVLDVADPYDGYARSLPVSPFLPAVMAACGVATVNHGMETVSPKFGVTHKQILRAAGLDVTLSPAAAAARLGDADLGWAYVDQSTFCPSLHDLVDFRDLMVKRSVMTTTEVLSGPIRGQEKTHLVTGYVHKPYARIYAMLARHAGFDSALLVRGVEGGVVPSLRQEGKFFYYHDQGDEQEMDVHPATDLDIQQTVRAVPIPKDLPEQAAADEAANTVSNAALAKASADAGLGALRGESGASRDGLIYAATMCLHHLHKHDNLQSAAKQVRDVLESGAALARLK